MSWNHLKISTRLILGFGLMALMIVLIGAAALLKSRDLHGHFSMVVDDRYPKIAALENTKNILADIEISISNMLIDPRPANVTQQNEAIHANRKKTTAILDQLQSTIRSVGGKEAFDRIAQPRKEYVTLQDRYIQLIKDGQLDAARVIVLEQMPPIRARYHGAMDGLIRFQSQAMDRAIDQAASAVSSLQMIIVGLVVLALIIALLLAIWIIRSITGPIGQAVQVANAVAAGDLTHAIDAQGNNETAQLLQALKRMEASLVQVVTRVRQGSDGVATASAEIAQGNHDLSGRTESQASALEETAASMEQLSSTVRQNADNARQANQLAQNAASVATNGGAVVSDVVRTMKEINDSSSRIADIIGVIDSIAFQTNILALNAAVEAARAGEQGRGFAVVAGEVRSLAQKSAAAAREISSLIQESTKRTLAGTQEVERAGAGIRALAANIQQVADLIQEVNTATVEQTAGLGQISAAVSQLSDITQQNAALVEESAAASASLNEQAVLLLETVHEFRIEKNMGSAQVPDTAQAEDIDTTDAPRLLA